MEKENISIIDKKKNEAKNRIKPYDNLTHNEKYNKFIKEIENLIKDIKNEDIDIILDYTSSLFFNICLYLSDWQIKDILNQLSQLYHKLKSLYFFNIMVSLYSKIESIKNDSKFISNFNIDEDLILQSLYDYEKNKDSEYKNLVLNIKTTKFDKFNYLVEKIEEIFSKENIFLSYDLIVGDFEEGYSLKIKLNDKYLIINDISAINCLLSNEIIALKNHNFNFENEK